jgi:hypothetical protein
MNKPAGLFGTRKRRIFAVLVASFVVLFARHFYVYGQDKSGFPDGYDAVQAAPDTHKVIFENAFVRVLEVAAPPPGGTIPMPHHRWPSFFLDRDTGGGTPHIRYRRPDGSVRDTPSPEEPARSGTWHVQMDESRANARHCSRLQAGERRHSPRRPSRPSHRNQMSSVRAE